MPTLRKRTSDAWIWRSVFTDNEYGLLEMDSLNVIDAGANIGAFACLAAAKGAKKVVAVEPFGPNFEVLCSNASSYGQIIPLQRAIGGRSGDKIKMRTESEFVEQRQAICPEHALNFGGFVVGDQVAGSDTVESISIQDIITEFEMERVDILKLDCESAEWSVFKSLEPRDFVKVGEICGEYHLLGNVSVLEGETDPLGWLRGRLLDNGFEVEFLAHVSDNRLGWFYARNQWVKSPKCQFVVGKKPVKSVQLQQRDGEKKGCSTETIDSLTVRLYAAESALAQHAASIAELKQTIDTMNDKRRQRLPQRIKRKARKLRRDPVAFFRDASLRKKQR